MEITRRTAIAALAGAVLAPPRLYSSASTKVTASPAFDVVDIDKAMQFLWNSYSLVPNQIRLSSELYPRLSRLARSRERNRRDAELALTLQAPTVELAAAVKGASGKPKRRILRELRKRRRAA